MINFIPEHFYHHSAAYRKIREMEEAIHNDQELGKEVRIYLNRIKEGKEFKYSYTIELDKPTDENKK